MKSSHISTGGSTKLWGMVFYQSYASPCSSDTEYSNFNSSVQCSFFNTLSIISNHYSASKRSIIPLNSVAPYFSSLSYCLARAWGCTTGVWSGAWAGMLLAICWNIAAIYWANCVGNCGIYGAGATEPLTFWRAGASSCASASTDCSTERSLSSISIRGYYTS